MIISPLRGEKQAIEKGNSNRLGSEIIQTMLNNAERLKKHINQMLNLSKLESGSVKLEVREHDFLKYLQLISENFKILGRDKDITIHLVNINVHDASLYYDEERMEQNFVKFAVQCN